MSDNYILFEEQLESTCKTFPNLRVRGSRGRKYLYGTIDICNVRGEYARSFLIEIHCSKSFPYGFPDLFEVGGDIPYKADWHKYSSGLCCITVKPDEILKCRRGITIIDFIRLYVVPYLANQYHRLEYGYYLNEYSHGSTGLTEYYTELLGTSNKIIWLRCFRIAFGDDKENLFNNQPCFCGSGLHYDFCHKEVVSNIRNIGRDNIIVSMRIISMGDNTSSKQTL